MMYRPIIITYQRSKISLFSVCLVARSAVGRPSRQVFVKRSPVTANNGARSPSVARHASSVRRAASFRPEDISTPTFQSSTNSLLAATPTASRMAEERLTPQPVRSCQRLDDERIQPTRVAPPPPTAQSSASSLFSTSFDGLHSSGNKPAISSNSTVEGPQSHTDQLDVSSASSSFSSEPDNHAECDGIGVSNDSAVRAPPRPRHTLNKVVRAESLRQQQGHPSSVSPSPSTVNHGQVDQSAAASVVASLRDRFEARRRAASRLPDISGTTSSDDPETVLVAAKPNIPPKPRGAAGKDDVEAGRRAKRLQRQPAFREFDVVNASKFSASEVTNIT